MILRKFLHRYQAPAGYDGGDTAGADTDLGNDFTPPADTSTGDEVPESLRRAREEEENGGDRKKPASAETAEQKASREDLEAKEAAAKGEGKGEEDDDKGGRKDTRIPVARHKEILEKERAKTAEALRQLEASKKGAAVAATNEEIVKAEDGILALEKDYNTALADGKLEEAAKLMSKIRHAERDITDKKVAMRAQAAEAAAYERVRYDNVVDRLEAAYPQFVQGSDEHDPALIQEVLDLQQAYRVMGLTAADALQKAARKLMPAETKKQERAVETDVKVDKKDVAAELKKDAVKRNVETAGKQPPSLSKVGMDSDKAGGSLTARDMVKLNQNDFAKVAEQAELMARERGDFL